MHIRLFMVAGASLLVVTAGCKDEVPKEQEVVRPVKIHTIGSLDPAAYRDYPGTVKAYQEARMGFEVAGRVDEFLVREGDEVAEGDVLARLDPSDYEAALRAAQADLDKAKADRDRSLSIRERNPGAIAQEQIDADIRAVEVAEAQLAIAQKAKNDTELRAPFSGMMARKLVPDFANVQAKEPVLILQDVSILEIEVNVPERDFARRPRTKVSKEEVTERLKPEVIVSAVPDQAFPARIKEFATTAEPITRTFAVTLNFDPVEEYNIMPGMTARVRVVVDPERAWSVPTEAVRAKADGEPYVWKVDPDTMTVSKCPVEWADGMVDGRVLLKGGVEQGEMVAVSGVLQLREGRKVSKFETTAESKTEAKQ